MLQRWKVKAGLTWRKNAPYYARYNPSPGDMADVRSWIDQRAAMLTYRQSLPSMSVSVVHEGKPLIVAGYGSKDSVIREGQGRHLMGSITKTFTSIACIQLANEGKLSLDDPIRRYVPEFDIRVPPHVKNGKDEEVISQLTIRTLLQQRSGLPASLEHKMWGDPSATMDSILEPLKQAYLVHSPKTYYLDSDVAFSLLGILIQRVTDTDFGDYVTDNVFAPLGMQNSDFDLTKGYLAPQQNAFVPPSNNPRLVVTRDTAARGMISTPVDMSKFLVQVIEADLKRNETPAGTAPEKSLRSALSRIQSEDLGLLTSSTGPYRTYWQNGTTLRHTSLCAWIPDIQLGLNVSSNVASAEVNMFARQLLSIASRAISGIDPPKVLSSEIQRIPLDDFIREQVIGTYTSQIGIEQITEKRGKLWIDGPAPQSEVIPIDKGTFPRGPIFNLRGERNYSPSSWKFQINYGPYGKVLEGHDSIGNMSIIRHQIKPVKLTELWTSRINRVWRADYDAESIQTLTGIAFTFVDGYIIASIPGREICLQILSDDMALAPGFGVFEFSGDTVSVNGMNFFADPLEDEEETST